MNKKEIIIQANLCDSCGEVWFSPHFKTEGEQGSCPYCKKTLAKKGKMVSLEENSADTLPEEIKDLMDTKTSEPLKEKVCVFCKNFILVSKSDLEKANHCPYCGDKLVEQSANSEKSVKSENSENFEPMPFGGESGQDTFLDNLIMKPVIITLIDTRPWLFRKTSPQKSAIVGIYLGSCPATQMIRVLITPDKEIKWIPLSEIEGIQEVLPDTV